MASRFRPFGLAASLPAALLSPLGLGLLGGSLILAAIMAVRGAPTAAVELAVWGALMYAAAVALNLRRRPNPVAAPDRSRAPEPEPIPRPVPNPEETRQFEELVEEALRGLNEPSKLAKSGLVACLPRTLAAARRKQGDRGDAEETDLSVGRRLRSAIAEAIERLKPVEAEGTAQALQYHVLREEYVLGRTITSIALGHSVSEQTVFRRRREGIEALAADVHQHEASLPRDREPHDPTAMDYLG